MKKLLSLALAGMIGGAIGSAAPAQEPSSAIEPPGSGMIAEPCPQQQVPDLPAPGRAPAASPEVYRLYGALMAYQKKYDWGWLCRYKADNDRLAASQHARVVFMGDSITEGWQRFDSAMFTNGVVDRGISGQTSPQILLRFYQDVIALKPGVVHIMAGTNDLAGNLGPTSPDQWKNNIRAMIDLALANKVRPVLASILPAAKFPWASSLKPAIQIAELNAWLRSYAAQRHLVYADYHSAMADAQGGMKEGLSSDGVHPNAEGYKLMRPIAEKAIAAAKRSTPR